MFNGLPDLKQARILISNDDGIDAPGLRVLEEIARSLSDDVWVVAPESEQSAVAHALTIRRPLRIRPAGEKRFSVDGTPTDCVLLAVRHILKDRKPDVLLSGINRGGNLGEDVTYSGTVAAAIEGTLLDVPSIALSQVIGPGVPDFSPARQWAGRILGDLLRMGWRRSVLMNVNFPEGPAERVSGVAIARQGKRKLGDEVTERLDPRGDPYVWIGSQRQEDRGLPGSDLEASCRGRITITPLGVDLTDDASLGRLRGLWPDEA